MFFYFFRSNIGKQQKWETYIYWTIAALLEKQVQSGVRWEVTVRRLAELGVDAAIEIGPGRALTGFVKKTVGSAISCYPVETAAQLQQLLRTMKGA